MSRKNLRYLLPILFLAAGCDRAREDKTASRQAPLAADTPGLHFRQDTLYLRESRFTGQILELYPNGDSSYHACFVDGIEHGFAKKWYPGGQMLEHRTYYRGKKTGVHVGWWKNGQPKFEYHFSAGEHHGILREWYENGLPYKLFHYQNGYEEGPQQLWWENGSIRANYVVKKGRRYGLIGLKSCINPIDSLMK